VTPQQQIDNFGKGWIAKAVRYEPVGKLKSRLRLSLSITLILFALFVSSLVFGFGAWSKFGFIRIDMLLAILVLLMGVSALQMWRFINLRKTLADKVGGMS